MVFIRRFVHVAAWIGTLAIALLSLALIVSQTPWFRDWIRRTIIRESRQYLNGELSIGQVTGNLFFGVGLADVAVDLSGERVVSIKALALDYSVFQFMGGRIAVDRILVTEPRVHLAKDSRGWNIGRLVKPRAREADRQGPRRPIALPSIAIADGTIAIDDRSAPGSYRLPRRVDDLDFHAAFVYEPVHFTLDLTQFSFRAADPGLSIQQLTGTLAVRDDNLFVDRMVVKTDAAALNIGGVIESYLRTPVIKLAIDGTVSLREAGQFVPVLSGYALHPVLVVKAIGPIDRLLLDLNLTTEAGLIRGPLVTDLRFPDFAFAGPLRVERLNLAPILKNPAQRSDITGDVRIDLTLPSSPSSVPALDRLGGTFVFSGSRAVALGYDASQVRAAGAFKGPRITVSEASARAYGASATTRGLVVLPARGRPVSFDLEGTASNVDLRQLPASTGAPKLETVLSVSDYHVKGSGSAVSGAATLNQSIVEGATIGSGTIVEFDAMARPLSYATKGRLIGMDVRRLGKALEIGALDDERFAGRVSGDFDMKASGTGLDDLTLAANGTLTDSAIWGTHVPSMTFQAEIANRALTVQAKGAFDHLNPAVILGRKAVDGNVNGTVDATLRIADLSAPVTSASVEVDGGATLAPSLVGGVQIGGADVTGRYAGEVADITMLHVEGPDVTLDASGRLAVGRDSASNLKYHVNAADITELGRIAGRDGLDGTLVLEGTITGNAASLATSGTLKGNGLASGANKALDFESTYAVSVQDLDADTARVEATTRASIVELGGVPIDRVVATTTYAQKKLEFETTVQERGRALAAAGTALFHADHQEIHLSKLGVTAEGVEWRNVSGSEAVIQYGPSELAIKDLRLASGGQTLEVSGSMALDGGRTPGAVEGMRVQARNVDLARIETLLLQNRGFSGLLTAGATITGSLSRPVVDGRLAVTGGGFQAYRYQSLTADVDYQANRITLDAALEQGPGVTVTARGTVPTSVFGSGAGTHVGETPGDAIDVRLQAPALDLAVIQGFTTLVTQVGGTLEADVRIAGSGRDPHIVGYLDIRDGAFAVPQFGTSYSGLDTRIDLEPEVVRVRRFEILDENGEQLAIAGQLAVHERQAGIVDFTIESSNFEIIDNELGDVGVGTNLKITGELVRPKLEGDIRVAAGRLEVDRVLRLFYDPYRVEALPEVESAERTAERAGSAEEATRQALARAGRPVVVEAAPATAPKETTAPSGVFENVALDVRLRIPDNLILRGRRLRPGGPTRATLGDLNITLGGDLNVRKETGGPVTLAGIVNTVRGTYRFQNRQFDLMRDGTIRFTGDAEFNPVLDVSATRDIPDTGVEAKVRVTGTLRAPELALSSTPPLEESDVLALIVFNRPINELGTGERASLAATAGQIATGFIATPLGESIGRALDLDIFEITANTDGDTLGAGITIGDQVGDRTFLKLRQMFGEHPTTEFILEYQLADFLRLAGSAAPETSGAANRIGQRRVERAGIDLIFFFSY